MTKRASIASATNRNKTQREIRDRNGKTKQSIR